MYTLCVCVCVFACTHSCMIQTYALGSTLNIAPCIGTGTNIPAAYCMKLASGPIVIFAPMIWSDYLTWNTNSPLSLHPFPHKVLNFTRFSKGTGQIKHEHQFSNFSVSRGHYVCKGSLRDPCWHMCRLLGSSRVLANAESSAVQQRRAETGGEWGRKAINREGERFRWANRAEGSHFWCPFGVPEGVSGSPGLLGAHWEKCWTRVVQIYYFQGRLWVGFESLRHWICTFNIYNSVVVVVDEDSLLLLFLSWILQEPPEDDANIIERILTSRMVQKEVSGLHCLGSDNQPHLRDFCSATSRKRGEYVMSRCSQW